MPIEDNQMIFIIAIPVIALFIWTIIQQFTISRIKRNQKVMFQGVEDENLENIIVGMKENLSTIDNDIKDLYKITNRIHMLSHSGLHKIGMIRFNPFRDIGGDQSFSVALLDGDDNGIVISSLYSREGVRVYAKQLKKGISEQHQLTEEEKHAISIASSNKDGTKNKKRV
ncbi:MAG: DUF4446 family protein [Patescibacteria group bacterium]|nr:DUF4446 family protein [Patescibacteria group bacterium]